MEKIDLTKCNNCRAWVRYRYDRVYEGTGRIEKVTEGGGEAWMRFVADEDGELVTMWEGGKICEYIMDFEIIPRAPETYKDWQVGDVIYSLDDEGNTVSGEDEMCRVIFRSGELVAIAENYSAEEADINGCYTCSQLFREGWRLVLTDIERQIIEEKNEYKPQDGDICFVRTDAGNRFVFIIKKRDDEPGEEIHGYIIMATNSKSLYSSNVPCVCKRKSIRELRPATDEEKQMLFDALEKKGRRWNAEKKVVEDIPKPYEFRKGEPVLVRIADDETWRLRSFMGHDASRKFPYVATEGIFEDNYMFCIPYNERTMHLLGTAEDYKEEQL